MKLNIDCVRDVLLELESFPIGIYDSSSFTSSTEKYGQEDVLYSLIKLIEAQYINANFYRSIDGYPHIDFIYDISFTGHEFLEKIKYDGIWNNNIKPVLANIGSKSFDAIIQVATATISTLISKQLSIIG